MRSFRRVLIIFASAIVALPPSGAAAQDLPPPCSLLTTAEVEAALALPLSPPTAHDTQVPVGPANPQPKPIRFCMWLRGPQNHSVTLSVSPATPSAAQSQAQDQSLKQQYYDLFKKQGFTFEERTFSNGLCLASTPSAAARVKAFATTCTLQAKGMQLHVMASSTTIAVAPESVKKLVDLAITRLR